LFEIENDLNATPWNLPSRLDLPPTTTPLPKFKDYLPKFSGNGTYTVEDHLNALSNGCNKIRDNSNDVWMRMFINTLEEKDAYDLFDSPQNNFPLG